MLTIKNKTQLTGLHPVAKFCGTALAVGVGPHKHTTFVEMDGFVKNRPEVSFNNLIGHQSSLPRQLLVCLKERPIFIHATKYGFACLQSENVVAITPKHQEIPMRGGPFSHRNVMFYLPSYDDPNDQMAICRHESDLVFNYDYFLIATPERAKVSSKRKIINACVRTDKEIVLCTGSDKNLIEFIDAKTLEEKYVLQIKHRADALAAHPDNTVLACVGPRYATYIDL